MVSPVSQLSQLSLGVGVSPELWQLAWLRGLVPWRGFPALCLVSGDCCSHQNIASLLY